MDRLEDLPIRRKLTLVILTTCVTTLILAGVALATHEWFESRRAMVRDTIVLADILGTNSQAAVAFQDSEAATAMLGALRSEPHVLSASLHTHDGTLLAEYRTPQAGPPERGSPPAFDEYRFEAGTLRVAHPVVLNGKRIGTIRIHTSLASIYARLRLFAGIGGLVLVGSVLVALGVGSRLQRLISGPILALAHTAQAIAEKQDFSVRAQTQGRGEVGLLTHAFNQMLSGIEERDTALIQANQTLRTEVTEREQAERAAQAQLQRLDLLNQITRAIGGRHDLDSIYQVVLRHLEEALSLDFGLVSVYDATRRSLKVTHVSGRSRALARDLMRSDEAGLSVEESGLDGCVLGGVVYEPELEAVQGALSRKMVGAGLRSFVAAPLVVESQVFGVLIAARNKANDFHPGECEFLRQLSEHVALAAHQAELHGALQRAYNDLRQTQQTVMQQERLRALGQMASGIAHDINNAISPVALYTGALLEYEPGLSAQARSYLETIQRAVDDVAQTVLRMGEFYRTRESEAPLAPVDLNLMVEQVIDLTRARWSDMAQHRGVTVQTRTEFTPNLPAVMGTESEIREALTNLVFNAVDAMPQGGTLVLRTGRAAASPADGPARVVVEVIDAGTGMDEETRRRCLEPFFTTKGERGTGLGLAMVYGIARRQGADIEIDTELGRGTTIRLVFPVPQGVPGLEAANDSPTISGPMRILLVDDDPILLHSLRDVLETDGHRVSVADGGQAGIDSFIRAREDERPFAVVITDLGMPNVDGSKVASAIKGVSPETPVILLTGWGQRLMAEGTVPPHVDCVLSKPPRLQAVRASLARYVSVPEGLSRPRP